MATLKILKSAKIDVSEKELQELFEKNLESIEVGLKHVGSYVHIGTGIIDILAIDEDSNPVIIECKKVGNFDKDALIQLMNYYSWFSSDENHIRHLFSIFERHGFRDVTRDIRLIALVSTISDEVKNACWALKPHIMLVTFFLSKSATDDEVLVAPSVILDTSVGGDPIVHQPKTEDDHFKARPQMRPLYEKLKKSILEIDKSIKVNSSPQDYISFSGKKSFCALHVKKSWLKLDLLLSPEEAKNPYFVWGEKWGGWGYYNLESESKLEEALELIRKAFMTSL